MYSHGNTLRHISTTLGAFLTSTPWVYVRYCPTGTFSLVGQKHNQSRPRSIRDALTELLLLKHAFNIKAFMSYEIIFINKFFRGFVTKVFSLVSNTFMHQGYGTLIKMVLILGESMLYLCKRALLLLKKSGLVYLGSIRALYIGEKPQIKSDYLSRLWKRFWLRHFTGKIDVPFTRGCPFNGTRFDDAFRRAMKNGFHPIDLGEVYPIGMKTESGLGVGDGIVPSFSFESWKTWFLLGLTSFPESFESNVYSKLGVLEYLGVYILELEFLSFPFCERFLSFIQRDGFLFSFPSCLSKCKGFIIYPSSLLQNVVHFGYLRLGRV